MNKDKKESKMGVSVKVTRAAWRVMMLDKEVIGISAISALLNMLVFVAYVAVGIFAVPHFFVADDQA